MSDKTTNKSSSPSIACEVASCKYHEPNGHCVASQITVEAPGANCKSDTFCGTYSSNCSC